MDKDLNPKGLAAYRTYLGMSLHFRRGSYNGWDYNFNGKVKPETFEANRGVMHRYASLESKYPTKIEQIKFFYPAFRYGDCFIRNNDIAICNKHYSSFLKSFAAKLDLYYQQLYNLAMSHTKHHVDILALYNETPIVYNAYIEKVVSYESLLFLSLAIPSINKIVSNEPFLWNSLVEKLKFDGKFYALYLTEETQTLETLKQNTIAVIQSAWNSRKGND